jgi:hypothetical protein
MFKDSFFVPYDRNPRAGGSSLRSFMRFSCCFQKRRSLSFSFSRNIEKIILSNFTLLISGSEAKNRVCILDKLRPPMPAAASSKVAEHKPKPNAKVSECKQCGDPACPRGQTLTVACMFASGPKPKRLMIIHKIAQPPKLVWA